MGDAVGGSGGMAWIDGCDWDCDCSRESRGGQSGWLPIRGSVVEMIVCQMDLFTVERVLKCCLTCEDSVVGI